MRQFIRTHNAPYMGFGAFAPTPSTLPTAASAGVLRNEGHPGTMVVPVDPPELPVPSATPKTIKGRNNPNSFRPSIYIAHADYCAPPVPTEIDNVLPVPIPNLARLAASSTQKQRIGGITATRWPRPLIMWPTYGPAPDLRGQLAGGGS